MYAWQSCRANQKRNLKLLQTDATELFANGNDLTSIPLFLVENRAATAEMSLLHSVVHCFVQIDQLEIDVVDAGAAKVGETQIRLADFLGRLETMLVVLIGVLTRSRAFERYWREQFSAARRTHVKSRPARVRTALVGAFPFDITKLCLSQVRTIEACFGKPCAGQVGGTQDRLLAIGVCQLTNHDWPPVASDRMICAGCAFRPGYAAWANRRDFCCQCSPTLGEYKGEQNNCESRRPEP